MAMASVIMAPDETMDKTGTSEEEEEEEEEEELDYFSRLPESVIHYIYSNLPFKDIVRSSVLSKMWNRIWSNYPNIALELNANGYFDAHPPRPFLDRIEGIFEQCLFRKVCIRKLQLSVFFLCYWEELAPNMDRWLGAAIERNVSELLLKIYCWKELVDGSIFLYSIPEEVVVAHSLKVLVLEQCMVEDRFTCIELPHLHKLRLDRCQFVGENVLNKILCGCPELEFIDLLACEGMGSFLSVSCKPRLKYFSIGCAIELKRIEIFAPNLETFKYTSPNPCAIDLASCTVLKHLELHGAYLSTNHVPIQYLLSKLLSIEKLELHDCKALDQIKISSPCLKRLVMSYCFSFPSTEIDIPNLLGLHFIALGAYNLDNKFSSWNVPKVEEIHMVFSVKSFWSVCRAGLKGFLMKLQNYENLNLLIKCRDKKDFILHEKLHAVSFSSLNKFFKKGKPEYVVISSRREEHMLTKTLDSGISPVFLSLIFTSRQSIELLYEKLSNAAMLYSALKLVSTEVIEHEMDSALKSFMNANSTGYQTATIIFSRN